MAEKISNRLVLRVKRRRSNSPAEALIITDGVSQVKRAKKGELENKEIDQYNVVNPMKIFRFTATLNGDSQPKSTNELINKVLLQTENEIKDVKQKSNATSKERCGIKHQKSLAANRVNTPEKLLLSSAQKNAQARYCIVQSNRSIGDSNTERNDPNSTLEKGLVLTKSGKVSDLSKELQEDVSSGSEQLNDKELQALSRMYDVVIAEDDSKSQHRIQEKGPSHCSTEKKTDQNDVITCNGLESSKTDNHSPATKYAESEYVYDLYCHINHQEPQNDTNEKPCNIKSTCQIAASSEMSPNLSKDITHQFQLPDFKSAFGHATASIVGCDWESAKEYLTTDTNGDGMPSWWHRGGDIDLDFEASDDSNAEDNWRNDYPDEIDDLKLHDGDDYDELDNDDIYGFDAMELKDHEDDLENSDDELSDKLVYSIDGSAEFGAVSNKHGEAYARYKTKMQRLLGESDSEDEGELADDSSCDSLSNEPF